MLDDAEVNWDGDARFGIGDYRIPKVMLTFPNSTTFDPPKKHGENISESSFYWFLHCNISSSVMSIFLCLNVKVVCV